MCVYVCLTRQTTDTAPRFKPFAMYVSLDGWMDGWMDLRKVYVRIDKRLVDCENLKTKVRVSLIVLATLWKPKRKH